jgi:hypothetical protein
MNPAHSAIDRLFPFPQYGLPVHASSPMPLDLNLQHHVQRMLAPDEDSPARGTRLLDDAKRLWQRLQRFMAMNLIAQDADRDALHLACFALQLPLRHHKAPTAGRLGQISLKERAEQAAELLISSAPEHADEQLLDRATRILRDVPHRSAASPESRLLADAVNLDDFGLIGLVLQAMHLARANASVDQLADGFHKRRQYGYWEARLKDGFHFEPIRQIARQHLQHAQQAVDLLLAELREDQTP